LFTAYFKRGFEGNMSNWGAEYIGEACVNYSFLWRLHENDIPALVKTGNGQDVVYGDLFRIPQHRDNLWNGLKVYEGSFFHREIMPVSLLDEDETAPTVDAWVSVFDGEIDPKKDMEVFDGIYQYNFGA
jgi:hypothetical protein